jgi:hypothetical protein
MIGSFVGVILVAIAKLITTEEEVIDLEDISESLAEGTAEEETIKIIVEEEETIKIIVE